MSFYFISVHAFRGEADVWADQPNSRGVILYSMVVPIFCCCGMFGNILSLLVLKRKELTGSVYTYLAVLALVDLSMSIVLLFGGISRGVMWHHGFMAYDSLVGLPIGNALSTLGVLAIVGLTVDRVIYLWNPVQCTKPRFCRPWVAKRVMFTSFLISVLFNLPFCFIYTWTADGQSLTTTPFFDSMFYRAFNWMTLFLFAVLPAIILLLGNGFLIMSLRKARKINKKSDKCRTKVCKRRDHTNLTITLVVIIVFFLVTSIPENLVSRTAAINLLFQGNHDGANSVTLENFRQIYTVLGAIDVNANFIFYYTFCPAFCKVLKNIFKGKKKYHSSKSLQVNVFVLNGNRTSSNKLTLTDKSLDKKEKEKVMEISRKSIGSAFSINLGEIEDKAQHTCYIVENNNYGTVGGEYVDLDGYTPPFSTILEESSTYNNADSNVLIKPK